MKTLRLLITCIILLCVMNPAGARPWTSPGRTLTNHSVAFTNHMVVPMTNQQYYDKLSGICDTLYIIRKALFNKILSVTPDKNWAALSAERQNLHGYCLRQLAYLGKLPEVGKSGDFSYSLYILMESHRDLENILKDFDGFTGDTPDDTVKATFGKLTDNLKLIVSEHKEYFVEKNNYKKAYGLQ
jgi:hypothetical protein